jgi:voltage-gated potassium channel Kch
MVNPLMKIMDMGRARTDASSLKTAATCTVYFAGGWGIYAALGTGWSGVDSVYFAMTTVVTVGTGDVTPESDGAKLFTIFFAIFGIGMVGKALGDLAAWFMRKQEQLTQKAAEKMLDEAEKLSASVTQAAQSIKIPDSLQNIGSPTSSIRLPHLSTSHSARLPELVSASGATATASGVTRTPATIPKPAANLLKAASSQFSRAKHYLVMVLPVLVCLLIGLILGELEGWPVLDSLYWACITITTVGYGDISPQTSAGRLFAIFFLPLGVLAVTNTLRVLAEAHLMEKVGASESSPADMIQKILDLVAENKAAGGEGSLDESTYVLTMLVNTMGLVSDDTVVFLRSQFRILDQDGSGGLDEEDVVLLRARISSTSNAVAGGTTAVVNAKVSASAQQANPVEVGIEDEVKQDIVLESVES